MVFVHAAYPKPKRVAGENATTDVAEHLSGNDAERDLNMGVDAKGAVSKCLQTQMEGGALEN